jgi:hypothetical protein
MSVVDLYTVQIIDEGSVVFPPTLANSDRIAALMEEMEENLTDLLPAGYSARIRRWDHPDPDEGADDE